MSYASAENGTPVPPVPSTRTLADCHGGWCVGCQALQTLRGTRLHLREESLPAPTALELSFLVDPLAVLFFYTPTLFTFRVNRVGVEPTYLRLRVWSVCLCGTGSWRTMEGTIPTPCGANRLATGPSPWLVHHPCSVDADQEGFEPPRLGRHHGFQDR